MEATIPASTINVVPSPVFDSSILMKISEHCNFDTRLSLISTNKQMRESLDRWKDYPISYYKRKYVKKRNNLIRKVELLNYILLFMIVLDIAFFCFPAIYLFTNRHKLTYSYGVLTILLSSIPCAIVELYLIYLLAFIKDILFILSHKEIDFYDDVMRRMRCHPILSLIISVKDFKYVTSGFYLEEV